MVIYFVIIILAMLFLRLAKRSEPNKQASTLFVILSALVLIFFAGSRSNLIGVDTNNYINYFNYLDLRQPFLSGEGSKEFGFNFLQFLAKNVSDNYWALLFAIAIIAVFFSYKTIITLSTNTALSVFLYITLGTYLFFMNGARQGLAAAIFGMALISLIHRRLYKYIFWVLIASLFHRTVLIMLPFYFIVRLKFSIKRMILFSILSFVALLFLSNILSLFDDYTQQRYGQYEDRDATGGYMLAFFFVFSASLLVYFRRFIRASSHYIYDIYLYLTVFGALVYLVVVTTGSDVNFIRLSLYFSFGSILIWPIVLREMEFFKTIGAKYIFYSVHLVFYTIFLVKMKGYLFYSFNPDIISF